MHEKIAARLARGVFEHQMQMIGHEDERIEDPPRAPYRLFQPREQSVAVVVIADDVLPGVAARHDVVDRTGVLDS